MTSDDDGAKTIDTPKNTQFNSIEIQMRQKHKQKVISMRKYDQLIFRTMHGELRKRKIPMVCIHRHTHTHTQITEWKIQSTVEAFFVFLFFFLLVNATTRKHFIDGVWC